MFPDPVLRHLAIRVLKDGGTGHLVPADGAVVKFYKQGATVKTSGTVPHGGTLVVSVYHTGWIDIGDFVQVGADEVHELEVTSIDQVNAVMTLQNDGAINVDLEVGDRLIRTKVGALPDPALIYDSPVKVTGGGVDSRIVDEDGWAEGYVFEHRYDYTIAGDGLIARAYSDEIGSLVME